PSCSRDAVDTLQMALHANIVPSAASQASGVHHRSAPGDVLTAWSVTSLASDAWLKECFRGETDDRYVNEPLCAARVAEQACRVHRVVQLHLRELRVAGRHVPDA